jgi:hypothetical protein
MREIRKHRKLARRIRICLLLRRSGREFDRLVTISNQHAERMTSLIGKLLDIPAKTEAGRQAKASVVLACVLDWRENG